MKKKVLWGVATSVALVAALAFAQMGMQGGMGMGRGPGMMGHGPMAVSMVRHRYVMMTGVDAAYAEARNPLAASEGNLKAGKALFDKNCATCHGTSGRGDGPAAQGLDPPPADLTVAMRMPIASDAYLAWTILEGGVPVHSAMPPFKTVLSQEDVWKLVLYLRTL
ncbi:c-type cytochrome [Sulfuricystis multivorans]|uniref:c-type cytochrome n=1 Tax=Sulfuricystis multivorans TaxID=2211108 RepID=UPI000F84A46F|nr:cytochrome c [Sulfuricystis multivorans]